MGRSPVSSLSLADRAVSFINNLTHTGDFNGRPFELRPWQESIVRDIFKTREDGFRQHKKAFIGIGRKSGKTELVAAIVLFLLLGQGERRTDQEIYSASATRKQAELIWKAAFRMVENDPSLSALVIPYKGNPKKLIVPSLNNVYEAVASEGANLHGLNPSAIILDEVHKFPDNDLHEALDTALGARYDPLSIYITTAGRDKNTLCYELWRYAQQVRDGKIQDDTFLPCLFEAPIEADWTDPETWKLSLPGLGDFTSLAFIKARCEKAKLSPAEEASFRQLFLNQWIEDTIYSWLPVAEWDKCEAAINWSDFGGRPCIGGLDLSITRDHSALSLLFPDDDGNYYIYIKYWVPGTSALLRERDGDGVPYAKWEKDGWIEMSGESTTDEDQIIEDIVKLSEQFDIKQIGYDPFHATSLAKKLLDRGVDMVPIRQYFAELNYPSRKLETYVTNHRFRHDGNPALRWNISNVGIKENDTNLIMPSKKRSKGRIDGVASIVNSLALILNDEIAAEKPTKYIEHGPIFI